MGRMTIRFSDKEEIVLKERAKMKKLSVAEYIRRSLFRPIELSSSLQFEEEKKEYKKNFDELLEVVKMIVIQLRMGNSLQVETLRQIAPNEVADIVKGIKQSYVEEDGGT